MISILVIFIILIIILIIIAIYLNRTKPNIINDRPENIRIIKPSELDAILKLAYPEPVETYNGSITYGIFINDHLIGGASVIPFARMGLSDDIYQFPIETNYIYNLAIHPSMQSNGYGTMLLKWLVKNIKHAGLTVDLATSRGKRLLDWYMNCNFEIIKTFGNTVSLIYD